MRFKPTLLRRRTSPSPLLRRPKPCVPALSRRRCRVPATHCPDGRRWFSTSPPFLAAVPVAVPVAVPIPVPIVPVDLPHPGPRRPCRRPHPRPRRPCRPSPSRSPSSLSTFPIPVPVVPVDLPHPVPVPAPSSHLPSILVAPTLLWRRRPPAVPTLLRRRRLRQSVETESPPRNGLAVSLCFASALPCNGQGLPDLSCRFSVEIAPS
ncbi:hypothetical protein ACLOJK_041244 [Asimina triloba]